MQTLIQVLIERDGITEEQAKEDIRECRTEMLAAIESGNMFEAEEIFADWFGLEPDYLFDVI